jgi:hypothetical protein
MVKHTALGRIFMVAGLLMIPLLTALPSTGRASVQAGACTAPERRAALAEDQRQVLERVGSLSTLRGPKDVVALAQRGWSVLPHQWVSVRGMGVAIGRADGAGMLVPGLPSRAIPSTPPGGPPFLLMYRPSPAAADVTDPYGPDFPYELAAWAYAAPYDHDHHPTTAGACFTRSDWWVHERGIHDFLTWGMVPVPPAERVHGQDPGNEPFAPDPPGVPHPRLWTLHVWLDRDAGAPSVAVVDPHHSTPGIDPHIGVAFFSPDPDTAPR